MKFKIQGIPILGGHQPNKWVPSRLEDEAMQKL